MPKLVNVETNTLEDISQDSFHSALLSGKYNLHKNEPVNILDPSGQLISLPAEQVPEALNYNYKIPSQADIDKYEKEEKYGTLPEQAKTFAEAAASGATFGASRVFESGLLKNIEEQKARKEVNPVTAFTGELSGAIGSMVAAPVTAPTAIVARGGQAVTRAAEPVFAGAAKALANPETSPVVAKILASTGEVGAKALGSAVEGAVYGVGQAISESALGDADFNAENILHNVGYGAALGGAIGGAVGAVGLPFKKSPPNIKEAAIKDSIIENTALHPENPLLSVPESLDDIAKRVEQGRALGFSTELPQKKVLLEGEQILAGDSKFPVHALQTQSLESPYIRDYYKAFLESGHKKAQDFAAYEAYQKQEGVDLLKKYAQDLTPDKKITEDAVEGGNKLVKAFKEQYENEQKQLKPIFDEFDKVAISAIKEPEKILSSINQAVPDIGNYIYPLGPESAQFFAIQKYKSSMPFSKETHDVVSDLLKQFNSEKFTIGELRNIRESMRDKLNFLTPSRTQSEIQSLRKSLLDLIEDEINTLTPDIKVRDTFRRYAINEENRSIMERIFGGKISDYTTFAKEIKPEDVINRVFSNTVSVKAAKEILGDKFNSALGDYIGQNIARVTDSATNGFSSNKFGTFLKSKTPELEEAFSTNPELLAKIQAITNKMRILPDSPSINPSGTAKTTSLLEKISGVTGYLTPSGLKSIPGKALERLNRSIGEGQQLTTIDDILGGKIDIGSSEQALQKATQYGVLAKIERMAQETNRRIAKGTSAIFDVESPIRGTITKQLTPEQREKRFEKRIDRIKEITSDLETGVDKLDKATKALNSYAPNITSSLNIGMAKASQFLASKIPYSGPSAPLSAPFKPSDTEMAVFNRYYETVENPLSVLDKIKSGVLTKEHIETLQVVYPKLYKEMQNSILDKLTNDMEGYAKKLPYQTKLSLSMFLGQDLTNSLKPNSINSAQQIFASKAALKPNSPQTSTSSALSNISKANQTLTDVQRVENK